MYPLPAVVVNNADTPLEPLRAALVANAVTVAHEFASVDALLAHWASPPDATARMLAVRVRSLDDVAQMARLEGCFPGWPLLAVVEGDVDPAGLFRVSRAGAAQMVPYPFDRADFDAALDRLLLQYGLRKSASTVVAVCGVTEGCGATSVAVSLAAELAAVGEVPVVLTEVSAGVGRLAAQLNLTPTATTRDLLADAAGPNLGTLTTALVRVNPHLSVLAGQSQTLVPFTPPAGRVAALFRQLEQVATFVVADMPYTFDQVYFEALAAATRVFLVVRQDVPSVQAAKLVQAALAERGVTATGLILNQFDPDLTTFTPAAVGELLQLQVAPVASDVSGHHAAANAGKPLREVVPASPAVADLRMIAAALLEEAGVPTHLPHVGVWDRVRTFLSRMRN